MNVLIHCKTGNDRSAAIVSSVLISHFELSAKEAL
jgi:protein-tyrosine phosphatase